VGGAEVGLAGASVGARVTVACNATGTGVAVASTVGAAVVGRGCGRPPQAASPTANTISNVPHRTTFTSSTILAFVAIVAAASCSKCSSFI
jgi:hypothetical protein